MNKTAVVTGSEGFIGRHMAEELYRQGWSVTRVDIKEPYCYDARDFFRQVDHSYDLIVHAAAIVGGRTVIDWTPLDQAVDLALDAEMFSWARRAEPSTVVYLSSSAAYPVHIQTPEYRHRLAERDIQPDAPEQPDALYGWTKLTGERLANLYRAEGGRVIICRPFSGYGTDQDLTYPFPAMIERARHQEDPFRVWGTGKQVRDFVHVDDVIGAILTAYDKGIDGPFNICSGIPTSMLTLARLITDAAEYDPTITVLTSQPSGTQFRLGDPEFLNTFYRPSVSLEEGIKRALAAVPAVS